MPPIPAIAIPPRIRFAMYLLTAVGSALVAYAVAKDYIGDAEVALWAALASIVHAVAATNVPTRNPDVTDETGRVDPLAVAVTVVAVVAVLVLLGVLR